MTTDPKNAEGIARANAEAHAYWEKMYVTDVDAAVAVRNAQPLVAMGEEDVSIDDDGADGDVDEMLLFGGDDDLMDELTAGDAEGGAGDESGVTGEDVVAAIEDGTLAENTDLLKTVNRALEGTGITALELADAQSVLGVMPLSAD